MGINVSVKPRSLYAVRIFTRYKGRRKPSFGIGWKNAEAKWVAFSKNRFIFAFAENADATEGTWRELSGVVQIPSDAS